MPNFLLFADGWMKPCSVQIKKLGKSEINKLIKQQKKSVSDIIPSFEFVGIKVEPSEATFSGRPDCDINSLGDPLVSEVESTIRAKNAKKLVLFSDHQRKLIFNSFKNVTCVYCEITFSDFASYEEHCKKGVIVPPCVFCGAAFKNPCQVDKHNLEHHFDKVQAIVLEEACQQLITIFSCSYCNYKSSYEEGLIWHFQSTHSAYLEAKKLACFHCGI